MVSRGGSTPVSAKGEGMSKMGSLLMDTGAAMGSGVGDRIESYLERMAV